ncbi:unnamed protein product, partial [Polarella glacialis]
MKTYSDALFRKYVAPALRISKAQTEELLRQGTYHSSVHLMLYLEWAAGELMARSAEAQGGLEIGVAAALDWAPEDADEVEKEQIRSGLLEGVPDAVQDLSAESRNLREELLRERQQTAALRAEHASELERREAEVAKLLSSMAKAGAEEAQRREAEVASEFRRRDEELAKVQAQKPGGGSGSSSARQVPSPPPSGPGPVGPAAPAPKVPSPPPSRQSRMEV